MADWTESYRPSTLSEVRGNNKARDAFEEWGRTWDDHREAVILYGSPGVGKTSAAHALAADMGWETVELNASDQRTADAIERYAGRAAMNTTLEGSSGGEKDGGRQLVIVDEADNIHGNYDRGGAQAVTSLVKEANQPIVLIANEFYDMSRGLRNACQDIEFRDVSARSIVPVLRDICRKEGIEYDSDALQRIADANSGDLRGAVKDLQATAEGKDHLTVEDVVTGDRDTTVGIFAVLDAILKEEADAQDALHVAYDADETPDDLTAWVEDKVMKVYDPHETVRAYEFLANADRWLGRVLARRTTPTGATSPTTSPPAWPPPATKHAAGGRSTAADPRCGPPRTRRWTKSAEKSPTPRGRASKPPAGKSSRSSRRRPTTASRGS
jgi:replication factor C large subunit